MEMAKTTGKRLGFLKYPSLEHPRQLNTLLPTHMGHLSPEVSGNLTILRFIMYIYTHTNIHIQSINQDILLQVFQHCW